MELYDSWYAKSPFYFGVELFLKFRVKTVFVNILPYLPLKLQIQYFRVESIPFFKFT